MDFSPTATAPKHYQNPESAFDDRFVKIISFANELSDSRLREIKITHEKRWSREKRAEKSQLIQTQKPWAHATGPKTTIGKIQSSQNSGQLPRLDPLEVYIDRLVDDALKNHRQMLVNLWRAIRAYEKDWPWAERMLKDCMETADQVTRRLALALAAAEVATPLLDARLLVQQGAGFSDADMITKGQTPLSAELIETIEQLAKRRAAGEPVSRIAGGKEFWSQTFKISPATLDPRPDTETLVEAALKYVHAKAQSSIKDAKYNDKTSASFASSSRSLRERSDALRILDLGTGSGCILISLLRELPNATGVGIDLNPDAITIARENAAALGVESRIEFRCGSWFEPLHADESFDLIVSNPPYIPESEIESLAKEVRNHDPILALAGGADGFAAYKKILKDIKNHLVCGGHALFEIGQGQEQNLQRLVDDSNMRVCDSYVDLAGILRVVEISYGEN